jgi:glutamine cyclotransferase
MPIDQFGEGITILGDKLYQLTWKSKKGYVYDLKSMELLSEFDTSLEEGWGLTDDGNSLIMSDGTNMLYYMDPVTFEITRKQSVYNSEGPENLINEMEYVNGYIYANIYGQPVIAQIDAATGKTVAYIDCRGILPPEYSTAEQDVFNGIAYDPRRQTFFVTGKYWSKMFEVRFLSKELS